MCLLIINYYHDISMIDNVCHKICVIAMYNADVEDRITNQISRNKMTIRLFLSISTFYLSNE